jgi:signal transduction histidine kinase
MRERRSRDRVAQTHVTRLLRWRLLTALLVCLIGVVIAANDASLSFELDDVVLAFVVPALVWALLTLLARILDRRARNEDFLQRYRRFSQQLARCHDWDELIQFVERFPTTLWPGAQVELYLYNHGQERFESTGRRGSAGATGQALALAACSGCPLQAPPSPDQPNQAAFCPVKPGSREAPGLCVPLSDAKALVGRLHAVNPTGRPIAPDAVEFLEAAAPEMALALALAQASLQRINEAAVAAQRGERQQIAYALHDSLAQQVAYLHMSLDRMADDKSLPPDGSLRSELQQLRLVTGDIYHQIRDTLVVLRAHDNEQLRDGIAYLIETISAGRLLKIDFQVDGDEQSLPAAHGLQALSFVRECLNNVVKHAHARWVQVWLHYGQAEYEVSVADDGNGFDVAARPQTGHFGLSMMTEQIQALGGRLVVTSAAGQGTHVTITLPLHPVLPEQFWPFRHQHLPLERYE